MGSAGGKRDTSPISNPNRVKGVIHVPRLHRTAGAFGARWACPRSEATYSSSVIPLRLASCAMSLRATCTCCIAGSFGNSTAANRWGELGTVTYYGAMSRRDEYRSSLYGGFVHRSELLAVSRKPIALPDALVYELYGLTEDEIRIVEGET